MELEDTSRIEDVLDVREVNEYLSSGWILIQCYVGGHREQGTTAAQQPHFILAWQHKDRDPDYPVGSAAEQRHQEMYEKLIALGTGEIELSAGTVSALQSRGIYTVTDLLKTSESKCIELLGARRAKEIAAKFDELNLSLGSFFADESAEAGTSKVIKEDYARRKNELHEQLTDALSSILLGEKIPLDVVNAQTGEIIIPANLKITRTRLRKLARAYDHVESDPSPIRNKIREIIGEFEPKFAELDLEHERQIDKIETGEAFQKAGEK
ncbi:MAG: hypothetical protein ABI946_00835 [Chthoniobacterales bacterium]